MNKNVCGSCAYYDEWNNGMCSVKKCIVEPEEIACKNHAFYTSFVDDKEKMRDFFELSKEDFLKLYSYLTEEEYDLTKAEVCKIRKVHLKGTTCGKVYVSCNYK